jgi:hypothetical protein
MELIDKVRLEQIKNRDIKYLLGGTQLAEDWEWLIYQARKAIELEKTIELYHFWYSKAYEQNKNLKHILKFYADEEKYNYKIEYDTFGVMATGDILDDCGEKARKVLEEVGEYEI